MITGFVHVLAALVVGHALCDFPLQGQFLADRKSPRWFLDHLRGEALYAAMVEKRKVVDEIPWRWCMAAHCAIHAGAVWLVTGSLALAGAEFVAHWAIDVTKCHKLISFGQDQAMHLACKVLWALLAVLL